MKVFIIPYRNREGQLQIFLNHMKYLLEEGEKIGIYKPIDYKKSPQRYCGMEINSTPYEF